jgi:hypothetical protein
MNESEMRNAIEFRSRPTELPAWLPLNAMAFLCEPSQSLELKPMGSFERLESYVVPSIISCERGTLE